MNPTIQAKDAEREPRRITADARASYYQFEDINNAIIRLLREPQTGNFGSVLDLGCGRARLGLEVERLGYKVTGIDNNEIACVTARTRISEVIEVDFTKLDAAGEALKERQFDWIMAADVLEHTPDPHSALCFYRRFLKPGGHLIVSLPNVAVWDNRLRILFGRFNYRDSGVMDRTHLRFFTFRTARELISDAGFKPLCTTWEPGIARAFLPLMKRSVAGHLGPDAILQSKVYHFYSKYVLPMEYWMCWIAPGLFAFRAVILARLNDSAGEPSNRQNQN